MSGLRSALEELHGEDLSGTPDARLEEDFAELESAAEALEAERSRRLGEIDHRAAYRRDGVLSTVAWLVSRFGIAWGVARERVRVARGLREMPRTAEAVAAREVSSGAVRLLTAAREAHPEAFARCEPELLQAARQHTVPDLSRVIGYWRQSLDEAAARADRGWSQRRLHVSPTQFGMVRVDGDLDAETGESLMTAIRAVMDAGVRARGGDDRTPPQRRADALGEICRQWLDRADRPEVGGERPHVTVTVDLDTLKEGNGPAELDHAGPVLSMMARRLACDSSITRVVLGPRSEPLDVGRRTPVVPPAMRRAVVARDRHCAFPACDRPHTWCDAHHVVHWADGGGTAVSNLVLLCRPHHRLVHESFRVRMVEGRPQFSRAPP